ncbi:hypothetical protein D0469_08130 [Peribacillus saganii]|uniref:YuiB family protein n=1 Tax=Peribacillus saganii TaxID=2303992 RepID=A0A372LPU9_9BACI|nr:YuiB family protein [Peribacillus saganii]RFU70139.1 hypothetical protein D0469_08130 [Peribacillus saganii]
MQMSLPVLIISVVLFFVLFFGIGFLLNMLFRSSWIMVIIFPLVAVFIINNKKLIEYFRSPADTFGQLGGRLSSLAPADVTILASGLAGAILAGVVIKTLRNKGYRMF